MPILKIGSESHQTQQLFLDGLIEGADLIDSVNSTFAEDAAALLDPVALAQRRFGASFATIPPILKLAEIATRKSENPLIAEDLLARSTPADVTGIVEYFVELMTDSGVFPPREKTADASETQAA